LTDLVALARNPVPSGALVGTLTAGDGLPLRFARWAATRGPRRGTICLLGGRTEFIEKYFETIADLRRRGFAVAAFDWRSQGGSGRPLPDPMKGHVTSFDVYVADLTRFMKSVVLPDCPPPYIALAHSMGASILLRAAAKPGLWFERLVLSAPMIAISKKRLKRPPALVRAYAEAACLAGLSTSFVLGEERDPVLEEPFENNSVSADPERWSRARAVFEAAPALKVGAPTNGWLRAAMRNTARLQSPGFARSIQVPALLLAAGDDNIVSSRATEEFAVQLKVGTHVFVPNARHEILQETDEVRQRFWAAFDAYLGIGSQETAARA
jgi:lysophospholipase